METIAVGPTRRCPKITNPKLIALLDLLDAKHTAETKPFIHEEWPLLGVAENASKREVKNAYRRQSRKLHLNKGGAPEACKAMYAA